MKRILSFFLFISISTLVFSQVSDSAGEVFQSEAFAKFETRIDKDVIKSWNSQNTGIKVESISLSQPYYSITYSSEISQRDVESTLTSLGRLTTLRKATPVDNRETTPNDNFYGDQWSLDHIGAPIVWDQTTGGTEADTGEEIVVAIVDDGFFVNNIELLPNLWINENEIPGNGIDDDQNGYVDDYRGYNAITNNDQLDPKSHGTRVAGIIGAKGDNEEGISGINWNIKLMLVGGALDDIKVIECYEYIKSQKELYINTNGAKGANILVTNFSGGISGKDESDIPEWCELYNSLGNLGILSVGAVENSNKDYAVDLDLPTRCTSDFLITTTNTDQTDAKVFLAGYSDVWVDLASPGEDIPSVNNIDQYRQINGTSASAPHVAGAIALLYSLNCDIFRSITAKDDLALTMKEAIMKSVVQTPGLGALTVAGGRLDIAKASLQIRELCGLSSEPLSIDINTINILGREIEFTFSTLSPKPVEVAIYDMRGRLHRKFTFETPSVYELNTVSFDGFNTNPLLSVEPMQAGMYVLVLDNGESLATNKILIQ